MGSLLLPVTYSFRIPSLHDSTPLDCRIHHPASIVNFDPDSGAKWPRKVAILAHPYAMLGGGFDDPIIENAGAELLAQGYIVGTFNFRHGMGAQNSSGRTSWTGKPELADYMSFAGALVCYVHALKLPGESSSPTSKTPDVNELPVQIVFGGYSYGSLVVTRLPPIDSLLAPFQSAPTSHAASTIHQLASSLAVRTTEELVEQHDASKKQHQLSPTSPRRTFESRRKSPVTVGGYDSEPAATAGGGKRKSQDAGASGRRSLSLDLRRPQSWGKELRSSFHAPRHHRQQERTATVDKRQADDLAISPAYLLISPLLPPLSFLIAPSLAPSTAVLPSFSLSLFSSSASRSSSSNPLTMHPTLILFGANDGFTGSKRLRAWCSKLAAEAEAEVVAGAGHFWLEAGAMRQLRGRVKTWAEGLEE
ncbi:Alpha/Beta hydrolase protein [Phyllosticta paracitricarpa]|uniref:Alpha/Beta hydrolase protein n=2 Tax=Phyllosticta TaxID=121621 RepID=A0ABR1MPR1_9PEZI